MLTGEKIEKRRIELGMTKTELATLVGTDRTVVRAWEKGENAPRLYSLIKLCDALKLNLNGDSYDREGTCLWVKDENFFVCCDNEDTEEEHRIRCDKVIKALETGGNYCMFCGKKIEVVLDV